MSEEVKETKEVKKKNKKKKHPVRTFFSLIIVFVSCFLIYAAAEDFIVTLKLKKDISDSESAIAELEQQQSELTEEKKNLEDPEYVKRYARGKYMFSKPGEQVFILPSKNDADSDDE